MVVNLAKLWTIKPFPSTDDLAAMFVLYFNIMISKMMKNGITESFIFIVDCGGIGWFNTPFYESRPLFNILKESFKAKVHKIFCVNCESSFMLVWNTVKLMIEAPTAAKVEYTYGKSCESMLNMISPKQIE